MPLSKVGTKLDKLYYSIGEVAEMFEVNTSLIRFWEKEFSIIKPTKNKKGNRLFTQKDIQNFERIFQLVKVEGYTLEGAKQQLRRKSSTEERGNTEILNALERIKSSLIALQNDM